MQILGGGQVGGKTERKSMSESENWNELPNASSLNFFYHFAHFKYCVPISCSGGYF